MILVYTTIMVLSFFIGSFPTGYLVAKSKGIDIKSVGSGNIGATNVTRAMGKGWGVLVLLVDALKGLLPVIFVRIHFSTLPEQHLYALMVVTGMASVLGHVFTPFLKFKGGKGVATTLGVILGINPLAGLVLIIVWLTAFLITHVSSIGALSSAISLPFIVFFLFRNRQNIIIMMIFAVFMSVFILFTHRENIKRLVHGEEEAFKK